MFINKNYQILIPLYILKTEFNVENPNIKLVDLLEYIKEVNSIFLNHEYNVVMDLSLDSVSRNSNNFVHHFLESLHSVCCDLTFTLDRDVDLDKLKRDIYINVPQKYYEILSDKEIIDRHFISKRKVYCK